MKQHEHGPLHKRDARTETPAPEERRNEPRVPARGRITIVYFDPGVVIATGAILDMSTGGFRIVHNRPELTAGREVRFSWGRNCGSAKVAWTRQLGDRVESGFAIISQSTVQ